MGTFDRARFLRGAVALLVAPKLLGQVQSPVQAAAAAEAPQALPTRASGRWLTGITAFATQTYYGGPPHRHSFTVYDGDQVLLSQWLGSGIGLQHDFRIPVRVDGEVRVETENMEHVHLQWAEA